MICFMQVLIDGHELSCHTISVKIPNPDRLTQIIRPDEVVKVTNPGR